MGVLFQVFRPAVGDGRMIVPAWVLRHVDLYIYATMATTARELEVAYERCVAGRVANDTEGCRHILRQLIDANKSDEGARLPSKSDEGARLPSKSDEGARLPSKSGPIERLSSANAQIPVSAADLSREQSERTKLMYRRFGRNAHVHGDKCKKKSPPSRGWRPATKGRVAIALGS